jgi:hypothetical protein
MRHIEKGAGNGALFLVVLSIENVVPEWPKVVESGKAPIGDKLG